MLEKCGKIVVFRKAAVRGPNFIAELSISVISGIIFASPQIANQTHRISCPMKYIEHREGSPKGVRSVDEHYHPPDFPNVLYKSQLSQLVSHGQAEQLSTVANSP